MSYDKVPTRLQTFCEEFNERLKDAKTLLEQYTVSFDAHCGLVTIHPWVDGNGRMARLLMNYIQFQYNLLPAMVKKEERVEYISALRKSQDEDDYSPFREYMFNVHIKHVRQEIEEYHKSILREPTFKKTIGLKR